MGCMARLYFAVYDSLVGASKKSLTSIAFPAIGVFGVCARASLKAVRDFVQSTPSTTIQTVKFLLKEHCECLQATLCVWPMW